MVKKRPPRNIVVVVGPVASIAIESYQELKKEYKKKGKTLRFLWLHDKDNLSDSQEKKVNFFDFMEKVNFDSPRSIIQALKSYEKSITGAVCRSESYVPHFAKVVPHLSYVKVPTSESLLWSVDKLSMRRRFAAYNKNITPKYSVIKDSSKKSIEKIEKKVGFPMLVKPSGLAQSLLVSINYHREELEKSLKNVFRKLDKTYRDTDKVGERKVLVEEFMEGDMYSIDAYVNSKGKIYFCPPVWIKTGKMIGFDDFFGYLQITPTKLKLSSVEGIENAARDAIHALGLRSSTAHVELIRTEEGWKIIEVGPRVGGFREELYKHSYGFSHAKNDLLIRMGRKPQVKKRKRGYTAAMKFFAKKEGEITSVKGVRKAEDLKSFVRLDQNKKKGDKARFAKNGGKSVFNIILHNSDRSKLLADIRRLEKMVKIRTK